jgi:hypothetical protein
MACGQTGKLLLANRTEWRGGVGFGLGSALKGLPEQFLDILGGLQLQVAEVLIASQNKALKGQFQRAGSARRHYGQWFA